VHGAAGNLPSDLTSEVGLQLHLGVGNDPNYRTQAVSESLLKWVQVEYGLGANVAGINPGFFRFDPRPKGLKLREDGSIYSGRFAAASPNTTRAYGESIARSMGLDDTVHIQLEFGESFRLLPVESAKRKSTTQERIAATMGVSILRKTIELVRGVN
jgi:hypothetical protein